MADLPRQIEHLADQVASQMGGPVGANEAIDLAGSPATTTRGRHGRRSGVLAAAAIVAVLLVGGAVLASRDDGTPERVTTDPSVSTTRGASTTTREDSGTPPIVEVTCDETTASVSPSTIDAAADGMHLLFRNQAAVPLVLNVGNGGDELAPGSSSQVLALPPGPVSVSCSANHNQSEVSAGPLTLADPDGLWTPSTLRCDRGSAAVDTVLEGARRPTPEAAVRWWADQTGGVFTSIEPGDDVVQVGYPEADPRTYDVVRDGKGTNEFLLDQDADGWRATPTTGCL